MAEVPMNPTGAVRDLLRFIGENPAREGLVETPNRVLKAYAELFAGYKQDPATILKTFEDGAEGYDEMVVLKDIEMVSFCEHHLLPFSGVAHVAYIPRKKIVGLSKLARLVDVFAKRLQVQERLTTQIVEALMTHLLPKGAACVIEASHACMACRGVRKQKSVMVTSKLSGAFKDDAKSRSEFLRLIGG